MTYLLLSLLVASIHAAPTTKQPVAGMMPLFGSSSCGYSTDVTVDNVKYSLVVDTGSSYFAVAGKSCPLVTKGTGCNKPDGAIQLEQGDKTQFKALYGTNNNPSGWIGNFTDTNVVLNGFNTLDQQISTQFESIVMTQAYNFFDSACDNVEGIWGLGNGQGACTGSTCLAQPLIQTLAGKTYSTSSGQGQLADYFALQLCGPDMGAPASSPGGRLWMGGADDRYFAQDPVWVPMTASGKAATTAKNAGYYAIDVDSFIINQQVVGNSQLSSLASQGYPSILDSGTTLFVLPDDLFAQVVQQLRKINFVTFNNASPRAVEAFWSGQGYVVNGNCGDISIPALQMDPSSPDYPQISIRVKQGSDTVDVDIDATTLILVQQQPCSSLSKRDEDGFSYYQIGTNSTRPGKFWGIPRPEMGKRAQGQCLSVVLGVVAGGSASGVTILGAPIFQDKIVIHDNINKMIGLVKSKGCASQDSDQVNVYGEGAVHVARADVKPVFNAPSCMAVYPTTNAVQSPQPIQPVVTTTNSPKSTAAAKADPMTIAANTPTNSLNAKPTIAIHTPSPALSNAFKLAPVLFVSLFILL